MRRVLVTGANRGIGLEFVRQLATRGERVLAACRTPEQAGDLQALASAHPGRVSVHAVEMTDPAALAALARDATGALDGLDLLLNNAGVNVRGERFGEVQAQALLDCVRTNAFGPFLLAQSLAPLLAKGVRPVVANISSRVGSNALTHAFLTPSYAISKAALNMASTLLARAMAGQGTIVVAFAPGWVRTAMGGAQAPLAVSTSVAGVLGVIERLTPEDNGRFLDHTGAAVPW